MRIPIAAAVISLLLASAVPAQELHRATPPDQFLKEFWAAHPEMLTHDHHHELVAGMTPIQKVPDDFNAATAKAFTISAHRFDFTVNPSPFVVNQGDSVTLDITSTDVTHGFAIEQYAIPGVTMNSGQHRTISFVANTPGTFTYACTVPSCGDGHSNMVGDFIVQAAATPPTITSFTPITGPTSGGSVVAITGTNFANGATVSFGNTPAVSTTFNSTTSLSTISPVHDAGDVTIKVSNPDGQSVTFGTYTYVTPGPSISAITPSSGSTAGGTAITIAGSSFASGATVTIGGIPATNVRVVNPNTMTAVTPFGPVNISSSVSRDVVVTNLDGSGATRSGGFTYTLPAPSVALIFPPAASPTGGTTVAIAGAGFTTGLPVTVTFGGVPATGVIVATPTGLTVTAPPHAAGTVDVVVTVGSAQVTSAKGFSYQTSGTRRRAVKRQ